MFIINLLKWVVSIASRVIQPRNPKNLQPNPLIAKRLLSVINTQSNHSQLSKTLRVPSRNRVPLPKEGLRWLLTASRKARVNPQHYLQYLHRKSPGIKWREKCSKVKLLTQKQLITKIQTFQWSLKKSAKLRFSILTSTKYLT